MRWAKRYWHVAAEALAFLSVPIFGNFPRSHARNHFARNSSAGVPEKFLHESQPDGADVSQQRVNHNELGKHGWNPHNPESSIDQSQYDNYANCYIANYANCCIANLTIMSNAVLTGPCSLESRVEQFRNSAPSFAYVGPFTPKFRMYILPTFF